jgi:hypothetical protein
MGHRCDERRVTCEAAPAVLSSALKPSDNILC